jgi:CO dehydrogenase maturation factor
MSRTIAITGKGGTGKTTIAALMIASLVRRGCVPVLAVDADPNACLDETLGVKALHSVGSVREDVRDRASGGELSGMAKREWLELKIAESLVEAEGFDLIAMGRPEGPGCYCYANNVLREVIRGLAGNYRCTVIDNEAGLENLSRRIVPRLDVLVMVGDPSKRGLDTISRLFNLALEMKVEYKKLAVIVNRARREGDSGSPAALGKSMQADYIITLPEDAALGDFAEKGASLRDLPASNPVAERIERFVDEILKSSP